MAEPVMDIATVIGDGLRLVVCRGRGPLQQESMQHMDGPIHRSEGPEEQNG